MICQGPGPLKIPSRIISQIERVMNVLERLVNRDAAIRIVKRCLLQPRTGEQFIRFEQAQ